MGSEPAPVPTGRAPCPVTHLVVPRYPLTEYLFEEMHGREDIHIIEHPKPRRRPLGGLLRALEVYALPWLRRTWYFDAGYARELSRIRPHDHVLFFALENRKDLQIARKFIAAREQTVWLWNPIESYRGGALSRWWYRRWLERSGLRAYTFDPADARGHGIGLAQQVYRHASPCEDEPFEQDVYFLGIDKGRLPRLLALKAEFEAAGVSTLFRIVADKRRRYTDAERAHLTTQWLPYRDSLRTVQRSRALLELLQSSQSGPTIRSMEAVFLNRKLVTNNAALRHTALYHPSRVFILGEDDLAGIRRFIDTPMEPMPRETLAAHDIQHWIGQFAR